MLFYWLFFSLHFLDRSINWSRQWLLLYWNQFYANASLSVEFYRQKYLVVNDEHLISLNNNSDFHLKTKKSKWEFHIFFLVFYWYFILRWMFYAQGIRFSSRCSVRKLSKTNQHRLSLSIRIKRTLKLWLFLLLILFVSFDGHRLSIRIDLELTNSSWRVKRKRMEELFDCIWYFMQDDTLE